MHAGTRHLVTALIPLALALAACGAFRSVGGVEPGTVRPPAGDPIIPSLSFPAAPVESNPDATWVAVASLAGEGNRRSEAFNLSGMPVRLRTNLDGDIALLAIFLVPAGTQQVAGFPDVITTRPGEEETLLAKPAGTYVLDVQSLVGSWTITVEEEA